MSEMEKKTYKETEIAAMEIYLKGLGMRLRRMKMSKISKHSCTNY